MAFFTTDSCWQGLKFHGKLCTDSKAREIGFAPINFEETHDLAYWSGMIPGKVAARAEAESQPKTLPAKRAQTISAPGSAAGPGTVATCEVAIIDEIMCSPKFVTAGKKGHLEQANSI